MERKPIFIEKSLRYSGYGVIIEDSFLANNVLYEEQLS
jgi:hypothetical protein